jgi:phosphatidylinositol-3-phosphatase
VARTVPDFRPEFTSMEQGVFMAKKAILAAGLMAALSSSALAGEGSVPTGVPPLQHVFLIMMENHGYGQIITNPNAPFTNQLASQANLATNYFAVAHPSLTNYLEVVGGSNFGVQSDNNSDWHNQGCKPNLTSGTTNTDNPASPAICPIAGTGIDAATPAIDVTNETQGLPGLNNIDGIRSIAAATGTVGKTIGDQLVAAGKSWKSYQESLPLAGADGVSYSDEYYTDLTNFSTIMPTLNPPLSQNDVVHLYASKHNPFVYFKSVQDGTNPNNSLQNTVGFEQLFADLGSGRVPSFSFITPNQCNDQHGRGNGGAFCNFDPKSDGSQASLNPALIYRGDVTVQRLVTAIQASPAWKRGDNAIVVMWDENDYSTAPNINQVAVIVKTNYSAGHLQSNVFYTHFSLLKTLEAGFHLPCLNHACDPDAIVMSDLFSRF